MHYIIVGLGNPGEEYALTRHNAGRIVLGVFAKSISADDFVLDKKINASVSKGGVAKNKVTLVEPETFMNKSGLSVKSLVKVAKSKVFKGGVAENLVVIHDDLDIPIGKFKISFNKSSGGHKGVESIIKAIGTEAFVRVRMGISPSTASGKLKKPSGEKLIGDFIVDPFKKAELELIKKSAKKVAEGLSVLVEHGRDKAMSEFNGL
ncbi:MAG: aminoacyl-tRNA hydrolase [Patescibacteria group bacterium]|mgnify:FL=1